MQNYFIKVSVSNQNMNDINSEKVKNILLEAKKMGFSDRQIAYLWNKSEKEIRELRKLLGVMPVYKTVDTCAAEFEANTPYHYSTYEIENESVISNKKKIII